MRRLIKYLKPYTVLIAITVVFLAIQAVTNLLLPDYMSNIVNIGIQQGGVENAVPQAISAETFERLTIFMDEDSRQKVLESYDIKGPSSEDYGELIEDYPAIEDSQIYLLAKITRGQESELNRILGRAFLAVSGVNMMIEGEDEAGQMIDIPGFSPSMLPEDLTSEEAFEMIREMPESQKVMLFSAMEDNFAELGEDLVTQMAISPIRAEYESLGMDAARIQRNYILFTGAIMLLLSLLSAAATIAVGYFAARTGAGVARDLREKTFSKVENFSNVEFDRFSTASLITRSTNDITQIQMLVIIFMRMVLFAPLMGIGGIILALNKSVSMSWIIAVAVITIASIIIVVFSVTLPRFRKMQFLIDRINLVIREGLSGLMVIRAFNRQRSEEERFDRANIDLTATSLFVQRAIVILFPVMMLVMNGISLLIVWVGANQVAASNIQVGDMMAFLQYAILIVMSFLMLSVMFIMFPRASVSASRVADVLDTEQSIKDPSIPKQTDKRSKGEIEFRKVFFRYPNADEDVIHDASFTAKPGETTAIIGSTGSGKSTLANLILRFYDVTSGSIMIDGVDIRDIKQYDLREKIGYVPQKSILFSGTIATNLRYAEDGASDERLREAARVAQALEFIEEKPKKFETEISQSGKNVSGGQSQRLSIARALVKDPEILILDDCFSALDFRTDKALRRALKVYSKKATLFIVAQRVGTVMNAEQIIVLDEGRIAGKGTHRDLMDTCKTYREIALSQLSMEELV